MRIQGKCAANLGIVPKQNLEQTWPLVICMFSPTIDHDLMQV